MNASPVFWFESWLWSPAREVKAVSLVFGRDVDDRLGPAGVEVNQASTLPVGDIILVKALIKVGSGYPFVFTPGKAVWVTVLTKPVSEDLSVSSQGDVNVVPGDVSPSSVSHVFLQCLLCLPSNRISPTSLASWKELFMPRFSRICERETSCLTVLCDSTTVLL